MDIKVGDIVEYCGVRQRVMGIHPNESVKLSKQHRRSWHDAKDVTLVKSFTPRNIQQDDYVHILDIPVEERYFSSLLCYSHYNMWGRHSHSC